MPFTTLDPEFPAEPYDHDDGPWRVVRVSVSLVNGDVGLDVETPTRYDRVVLPPGDARQLGELLIHSTELVDHRGPLDKHPHHTTARHVGASSA